MTPYSRRHFLEQTALAVGALPLLSATWPESAGQTDVPFPDIHIFSKHLQFLNYTDLADAAVSMGFDGIDLTVRPGGHVAPDRVDDQLPGAVDAFKKAGFTPKLMTTAVGDAGNAVDKKVLTTASQLGFECYRMNWYQYDPKQPITDSVPGFQQQLRALGELNKTLSLTGCYQNHAGLLVGASVWELHELLKTADPVYTGVQYDIRHATVEGGLSWPNGLRLLQSRIKSMALKDFLWSRTTGGWTVQNVPIGEGMVDFKACFRLLKQANLRVPMSLHIEYPMGGAEQGATRLSIPPGDLFAAMKRDLVQLKALWAAA